MVYYVAHAYSGDKSNIEKAKKITHDLQIKDIENCYISPLLAFSHLKYGEVSYETEMDICLDLLMMCDALVVASKTTKGVQMEIDLAKRLNMEVYTLGKDGDLRLFAE